jgi:DNA helicase-2/ATP-dependent DNA helicase PcrA
VEAEALGLAGPLIARTREIRDFLRSLPAPVPGEVKQATTETSVTGLVTYALCPQRFYWTDVDRLPRMPNAAAQRGTAIHRAIELHHLGQVPPDDAGEGFYDLPEQLDDTPPPLGGPYATFLASRFASSRPVLIEAGFSLSLDGLGIKGRIDAIYDSPAPGWEVVDFKSGRRPPPNDHGSRNVQLQAYAVAVDDGMFGQDLPDHLVTTFAYLGGGLEEVSDVVDGPWLDVARRRLSQLAEGILSQRFDPTPSPACHGCDFLRFCPAGQRFVEQAVPA